MISISMLQLKSAAKKIITALIWLGIWQILSAIVGLSVLIPTPLQTAIELKNLIVTSDFWLSVLYSVLRITIGFLTGTLLGTITGAVSSASSLFSDFIAPVVSIIKSTPVASFIILAVVWLKTGNVPSFATALIVFPFVYSNIKTGVSETDKKLIEMSKAFGVPHARKLIKLYIPSVKPYFISAATTALGLAWKAGIAAEVICNPRMSIGNGIYESKIYLETPSMFAWTAVVVILSIMLEKLMLLILKRGKKNDKN